MLVLGRNMAASEAGLRHQTKLRKGSKETLCIRDLENRRCDRIDPSQSSTTKSNCSDELLDGHSRLGYFSIALESFSFDAIFVCFLPRQYD